MYICVYIYIYIYIYIIYIHFIYKDVYSYTCILYTRMCNVYLSMYVCKDMYVYMIK